MVTKCLNDGWRIVGHTAEETFNRTLTRTVGMGGDRLASEIKKEGLQ